MTREDRARRQAMRALEAVGTLRYSTSDLVARWSGMNVSDVRRVLPRLLENDFVYRAGHHRWRVWFLTDKGAATLGYRSRGRTPQPGWDRIIHELAVAEVMLAWHDGGWQVRPVIGMIHQHHVDLDTVKAPRPYRSWLSDEMVFPKRERVPQRELWDIIPDFEARAPGRSGRLAIEVELSRKPPTEIDVKLIDYQAQNIWSRAIYYTDRPEVGRLLRRRIAATEAEHKVIVRELTLPPYLRRER